MLVAHAPACRVDTRVLDAPNCRANSNENRRGAGCQPLFHLSAFFVHTFSDVIILFRFGSFSIPRVELSISGMNLFVTKKMLPGGLQVYRGGYIMSIEI